VKALLLWLVCKIPLGLEIKPISGVCGENLSHALSVVYVEKERDKLLLLLLQTVVKPDSPQMDILNEDGP